MILGTSVQILSIEHIRKTLQRDKISFLGFVGSVTISGCMPSYAYYSEDWSDYDCVCSYASNFLIDYNLINHWEDLEDVDLDIEDLKNYKKDITTPVTQAIVTDNSGKGMFKVFQINGRIEVEKCS